MDKFLTALIVAVLLLSAGLNFAAAYKLTSMQAKVSDIFCINEMP